MQPTTDSAPPPEVKASSVPCPCRETGRNTLTKIACLCACWAFCGRGSGTDGAFFAAGTLGVGDFPLDRLHRGERACCLSAAVRDVWNCAPRMPGRGEAHRVPYRKHPRLHMEMQKRPVDPLGMRRQQLWSQRKGVFRCLPWRRQGGVLHVPCSPGQQQGRWNGMLLYRGHQRDRRH